MKEKMPTPKAEESTESRENELPYVPEDVIVASMHEHLSALKNGNGGHKAEALHNDIEHSYSSSLFEAYENERVPTLPLLTESAERAADAVAHVIETEKQKGLSEEDLEEERKIEQLLRGRSKMIATGIRSYIRTVLRFQRLGKMRTQGRDMAAQFEKADHERRRAHNSLLDSLQTFTDTVVRAKSEGLLEGLNVKMYLPPEPLQTEEGDVVVFAARAIEDRNYIRDWAIVAEMGERMKEIEELEKE